MATARARQDRDKPTIIKKYANRRLYDTGRSSYVTLDDLCIMVKENRDFIVQDAKTGEDLTRSVLTQIIVDQEAKEGQSMLPTAFLRQLIGFYGDSLQALMPGYLEQTLEAFASNQDQFRKQFSNPVSTLEEIGRRNMEMMQNAMRAWSPFAAAMTQSPTAATTAAAARKAAGDATVANARTMGADDDRIERLRRTIAEMEAEISRLSGV